MSIHKPPLQTPLTKEEQQRAHEKRNAMCARIAALLQERGAIDKQIQALIEKL